MEKKTRKIEINNLILPLFWAFILVLCVFILSSTAKASGLPYIVDSANYTYGSYTMADIEAYINQHFIDTYAPQYSVDFTNNQTIAYTYTSGNIEYLKIFTLINDTQKYYFSDFSDSYDNFDFETDTLKLTMNKCHSFILYLDNVGNLAWRTWYPNETQNIMLFGQYYTPVYINSNFNNNTFINNVYVTSDTIILANTFETPIEIGIAIIPNFINPDLDITTNYPNPPTWQTPTGAPTFDPSNIPQSTYLLIEWGLKDPNGPFKCLSSNLQNSIQYIGDCIEALGKSIIKNIQNAMTNLYQNFVSLLEPIVSNIAEINQKITEFADLFIHPFDSEEFEEQIENSSFFTNYHAIVDNCEVLTEIIEYAEERDHFSLYISFENPLDNSVHRIISSEISFDWLVPLRSVYRPFLWVCVLIELFVGGARVLTHALGGHGV